MQTRIENLVEDIRQAARRLDREEVSALCRQLIAEARRRRLPDGAGVSVLKVLQRKRYFDLLQAVAEALIHTDQATLGVRRRWVQSLIDQNRLDQALREAERLIADTVGDEDEHPEARGLKGRALKQRYVAACTRGAPDAAALRDAVRTYADAYYEAPGTRVWHGINTVALLSRARRDGVTVAARETPRQIAEALLKRVDDEGAAMDAWAMASGLEACVALGDREGAIRWANGYAA
ncbi:MAG TPA: tetratricopeptide repeat-containing protein, partial [Longimicrobium sp.]|nr:tetratricopeptide repeat-containing protein [Longimicrobium sp.]